MSENTPLNRRSRSAARTERLYAAREPYAGSPEAAEEPTEAPAFRGEPHYTPNEADAPDAPVSPEPDFFAVDDGFEQPSAVQPAEEPGRTLSDFSAYYRRNAEGAPEAAEPAFAPPPKFEGYAPFMETPADELAETPEAPAPANVYRPREATWAQTERRNMLSADGLGYQVEESAEPPRQRARRRKRRLKRALVVLAVLALLGGGAYWYREPLGSWLSALTGQPQATEPPFTTVATPVPVKAYDAVDPVEITDRARVSISELSGTVDMETRVVTDRHVLTRNLRADGAYDFYLFTADEGRLLCYFEGLGPDDMIPLAENRFYVRQFPWLVSPGGSALIDIAGVEKMVGHTLALHPLYNGWSITDAGQGGEYNYINLNGELISSLWFARAFPFTGEQTVAYVDSGNLSDTKTRYMLYVLETDGTRTKWQDAPDMTGVVGSVCGMAYFSNGELYRLTDRAAPLCVAGEVRAYLDCDALVVRDAQSGKYGLFVHGEQHYDFAYDSIRPVESDMEWAEKTLPGAGGDLTVCAVTGAAYPQPLSHSFVLLKDGQEEYVALSTASSYPILLNGEF